MTGMFLEMIQKHGHFFRRCPVPKGFFYAYNLTLNEIDLPPIMRYYMGSKNIKLMFQMDTKEHKKLYKLSNVTFWGGYKNI